MSYPEAHNYLTVHWNVGTVADEHGQFGLRFDGPGPVSQALVDGAAAAVSTFWAAATSAIPIAYQLSFLRLARIGTNGEYVPGTQSWDHTYAPVVPGGGSAAVAYPLQVAHVATLRTGLNHGLAHSGRIYLPPLSSALDGTYLWSTAGVSSRINTLAAMLSDLDGSALGDLVIYSFGNTDFPAGAKVSVTGVQADTRADVQRRRAGQQPKFLSVLANVS